MAGIVALALGCGVRGENTDESTGYASESPDLVITQLYTGGGSPTSAFKNDYLELYNKSEGNVNLKDYKVQYTPAGAAFDSRFAKEIPELVLKPHHYALLKLGNGTQGLKDLPAPADGAPTLVVDVNFKEDQGKVAIVKKDGPGLNGCGIDSASLGSDAGYTLCSAEDWVDFVGYGREASQAETAAAASPDKSKSLTRVDKCKDTGNNAVDFKPMDANPHATGTEEACGMVAVVDGGSDGGDAGDGTNVTDGGKDAGKDGSTNNNNNGGSAKDGGKDGGKKKDASATRGDDDDDDDDDNGETPGDTNPTPKPKPAPKAPLRNGASDCAMAYGPSDAGGNMAAIGALAFAVAAVGARRRARSSK